MPGTGLWRANRSEYITMGRSSSSAGTSMPAFADFFLPLLAFPPNAPPNHAPVTILLRRANSARCAVEEGVARKAVAPKTKANESTGRNISRQAGRVSCVAREVSVTARKGVSHPPVAGLSSMTFFFRSKFVECRSDLDCISVTLRYFF